MPLPLVVQLKKQGVKTLYGDIWLDGEVFSEYDRATDVSWDDLNVCFAAPAMAMVLDRNCFYAWLEPGTKKRRCNDDSIRQAGMAAVRR